MTSAYGKTEELASCRFCVDVDGLLVGAFTECAGLSGEVEVEPYSEGGLNDYEHKLPGRTKYGNVTLKSGVASAVDLWDWFYDVATGTVERKDLSIIMYKHNFQEAMRWNLYGAFPVKWTGPDFTAGSTDVSVHSLELAHNGISLVER